MNALARIATSARTLAATALPSSTFATCAMRLVPALVGLVRPLFGHSDITRLNIGQFRELGAELRELQTRDLLVKMLRQHVNTDRVFLGIGEQFDLRKHLIRERRAH